MKKVLFVTLLIGLSFCLKAQKYLTRTGTIEFFSETPMENIEAINNQVSGVLNMENGEMAFTLLMKAFTFEKALMQEHFNEKYVESEKFPKASFKGSIENFQKLNLSETPSEVSLKGKLTIHGVTKDVFVKGNLTQAKEGKINGISDFTVMLDDYDIKVPSAVKDKISNTIVVKVSMNYEKMD